MNKRCYFAPLLLAAAIHPGSQATELEEVIVSSNFRPVELQNLPTSISVVGADKIESLAATHIQEIMGLVPNVNYASGSSRARYFQIRGIGERSQFREPINPSVGFIIDGVDFSGIGGAATLLDIEQIEVLRGPQGTLYGANALAGLINVHSRAPVPEASFGLSGSVGEYGSRSVSLVAGGSLGSEALSARLALQSNESDGYIENRHLQRDDTNNIDETTARLRLRWQANSELKLDLTLLHVDIDNGYDAFAFDSSRNTLSDEPGHDRQRSNAITVAAEKQSRSGFTFETRIALADNESEYGYDEDWSFVGIAPGWEYSSFDNYLRDRDTRSIELRLVSDEQGRLFGGTSDWVIGLYRLEKDENLTRQYTYQAADFHSRFDTSNSAVFAQLDTDLGGGWTLSTGLRLERWKAEYSDSDGVAVDPEEDLYGGKLALQKQIDDDHLAYLSMSRGYKAGGVNTDGTLPLQARAFETETLWSYEAGLKSSFSDGRLQTRVALFFADRRDQQVRSSFLLPRDNGSTEFIDYVANAAEGSNSGLELELEWRPTAQASMFANLAVLDTEFDRYFAPATGADPDGLDLSGRDQAHAPNYQAAVGGRYEFAGGWFASANLEAKDGFYFSDRHSARAESYALLNARIGYAGDGWEVSLWGRNLNDTDVMVRGFGSFGNDPRKEYIVEDYIQLGEPRILGLSFDWQWGE